ncbi:hypothetical protein JRQ81_003970 [Phrynocephalus forsythii]|uniref:NCK associated protein 5 n=1 Tax=Phrynocephalus forsythii TaxID=171643 RepID=A0A9Q0XKT8_9SAUR|nr:hypothetical protein JRQ81_003970 [Phrynocephalus forsythii]
MMRDDMRTFFVSSGTLLSVARHWDICPSHAGPEPGRGGGGRRAGGCAKGAGASSVRRRDGSGLGPHPTSRVPEQEAACRAEKEMMSEAKLQGEMKAEGGSVGEPGTNQELLQRLQELEAENSALAQANENQRETYERCLDEVANHVVQALLNQKDLREECIKLKKRVFDLERQNQALSDLFHQKLTSGPLSQFPAHPASLLLDPSSNSQPGMVEKLSTAFPWDAASHRGRYVMCKPSLCPPS